ncbi:hypothetical protein HK102_003305 [Quaeritorhiza haematococci]|nr:hypothetical protein HK102_003305 [Quaeritorhiza haematococci]
MIENAGAGVKGITGSDIDETLVPSHHPTNRTQHNPMKARAIPPNLTFRYPSLALPPFVVPSSGGRMCKKKEKNMRPQTKPPHENDQGEEDDCEEK